MNCAWIQRVESEALDRLLSEEDEAMFHEHVVRCAPCRARYQQLTQLGATLSRLGRVSPPPELDQAVRAIWHPTFRPLRTLRLYPYFSGYLTWDFGKLRLIGHMAGLLVTTAVFWVTLASLADFSLRSARITGPGVYTYMTRPVITEPDYPNTSGLMTSQASYADYLLTDLSAESARLNDHTLSDFADNEMEATHEDSLSVVTSMDAEGRGTIEGVLHTPRDRKLFMRFSQLVSTSQFDLPPPQANPKGRVVWSFSRIFVTSE